eukprot:PITA_05407
MKFSYLIGIIGNLGVMKITLKPDVKPIKQRPYCHNPKYKEKVYLELDKMLAAGILEPMEESDWVSPMVIQEKKQKDKIRICVDLRKLNNACVYDPFPAPFTDEVLDNVGGHEGYSFTYGFSRYHQIKIAPEDKSKTTFATKWGCFQYNVMPFGLKNVSTIFSRVVIVTFKEFIHKFLEVSDHAKLEEVLILCPFWNLTCHLVCRQGLIVDLAKITVIINLEASRSVKELHAMLGQTGYYQKFIKSYAQITVLMERLLKKDATFCWDEECQWSLDVLKEKMVSALILVFLNWKKDFHVHVDASCIALGAVITHADEGELDNLIMFARRKLSKAEKNYSITEREGLAMVYMLQKFRNYLLGRHFKMYTNHFALKYLVNKPMLGGGEYANGC